MSEAYTFLRTLEHRLQMEHGLQTHTLPHDRIPTIANRQTYGISSLQPRSADFESALGSTRHQRAPGLRSRCLQTSFRTAKVTRRRNDVTPSAGYLDKRSNGWRWPGRGAEDESRVMNAARVFSSHLVPAELETPPASVTGACALGCNEAAHQSTHPQRAQVFTSRVAASLEKFERPTGSVCRQPDWSGAPVRRF